jgi:hypothetical protein
MQSHQFESLAQAFYYLEFSKYLILRPQLKMESNQYQSSDPSFVFGQ